MTTPRTTPSLPGDRHRRVFSISEDAAVLATEYFHAEVVASVVTGQAERAATFTRHLVRMARNVNWRNA